MEPGGQIILMPTGLLSASRLPCAVTSYGPVDGQPSPRAPSHRTAIGVAQVGVAITLVKDQGPGL